VGAAVTFLRGTFFEPPSFPMKKSLVVLVCAAFGLNGTVSFSALAPSRALSPADQAWAIVQAPIATLPFPGGAQLGNAVEAKVAREQRAAAFVAQANRAKDFQAQFPADAKAADAKLVEIRALVGAVDTGDATVEGRLATAVQSLRADSSTPASIQVQGVAAYEFSRRTRGLKPAERLNAIEKVAWDLARDFPDQPQGFESLINVAAANRDDASAKKILRDLLAMPGPAALKSDARKLLDRLDLVGKPFEAELLGANETAAKAALQKSKPTIVYTWVAGNPGSLALAAELKKRGGAVNVIALNLDRDPEAAGAVAQREALIGTPVYDSRGKEGALAQRLKVRGPAEVFLIDGEGIIREVRAQADLKNKLQQLGL
jgi:hypothetical protein